MSLEKDLAALGKNSKQIAETLYRQHCDGKRGSMKKCAIAQYLEKKGYQNVTVLPTFIIVGEGKDRKGMVAPEVITQFINQFDRKQFRYLETK